LRLNLSHVNINKLASTILFIRKFSKTPICIDTEGAQIRTRLKAKKIIKKNKIIVINKNKKDFHLYPSNVFDQLKSNDVLDIGFKDLKIKLLKKKFKKIYCKVINSGELSNSQGVHLVNRKIKLDFITQKDREAIKISKRLKIKNFALSFTNSYSDILKFNKLLKKENKIFKLETENAVKNLNKIIDSGKHFLIDRGDMSKETSVEMLPIIQRKILKIGRKKNKKIYVATNFLESMIANKYPTRGEANDIYNTLEQGASGLVLAAETAIGKYPKESVNFITKMIKIFQKNN
jgi:pyruvate kinase